MHKITSVTISLLFLSVLILPACANGQAATAVPAWQADWDTTLAAAKKEGKVVVYTGYGAGFRKSLAEAMSRKYGMTVEVVTGRSAEIAERVMREERTKTYVADIVIVGTSQFLMTFHPEGVLQSMEKVLILPEVVDPNVWWRGKLPWVDPDTKTYFQFYDYVLPPVIVNTNQVKLEEVRSWNDLLNPKWKGKIVLNDPTISGSGQKVLTVLAFEIMNWDYVNALAKQEPILQRDLRMIPEWIARGKYPISIGSETAPAFKFLDAGAPIRLIVPSEGAYVTGGTGNVSMLKTAPHPNAAKIFINFLLSREGQTVSARATGHQSARIDVPTDHVLPVSVRQPGIKYVSTTDRDFLEKEIELKKKVTEIFKPLLK